MGFRQPHLIVTRALFTFLLLAFNSITFAYWEYSGGCDNCHGPFNGSDYISKTDGTPWNANLMAGHGTFVSNCDACHAGWPDGVPLNYSLDATLSKGCVGCHGRNEDVTGNCVGGSGYQGECGSGAGLRKIHETNVSAGLCSSCHTGDAAPVGEQNNPSYYGLAGVQTLDACNADSSESRYGEYGLDNDGDGEVDADDSDCGPFEINPGLSGNWWGGSSRSGEGFLLEVGYTDYGTTLVVSFYTYDSMGNQVWLVGPAFYIDSDTATVDFEMPIGAKWGAEFAPGDVDRVAWGTGTFTFTSCTAGHVAFEPNEAMQALGFTNLEYDLYRDILTPGIQCPIANP